MKNPIEDLVAREYERLEPTIPGFCGCQMCREDVIAYALEHVPPPSATQVRDELLNTVARDRDQYRADIAVALLEGFRRVQAEPREGHLK